MDLILWRHAEAENAVEGGDDLSRSLTKKGERQAMRMASWLDRHLPEGTRVLVSPSRRTQQTVMALGRKFKLRDELVPETSVEDVMSLLKWHPETGPQLKGPVLVVGHQPYWGQLVARL
jgi:phosphohistidine phosphatase